MLHAFQRLVDRQTLVVAASEIYKSLGDTSSEADLTRVLCYLGDIGQQRQAGFLDPLRYALPMLVGIVDVAATI